MSELAKRRPVCWIENSGTLLGVVFGSRVFGIGARDIPQRRDGFLLDTVQTYLHASRQSSRAVLAAVDRALREIDAGLDAILVFVPAGEELACAYATGARAEHFARVRVRRDDTRVLPARVAFARCRSVYPGDGQPLMPNDRRAIALPMIDERTLRAIVYASSACESAARWCELAVRAVEAAATPFGLAVEREADRSNAIHDGLTGLLSPRAFRGLLHEEIRAIAAGGREAIVSLWFVDTDNFKQVNDRFGHPAGDGVLQQMAVLLQSHLVAGIDLAARNGGDEFCALVRETGKNAAIARAQAFVETVRSYEFGLEIPVTASIGVASFPHDACTSSALLEAADGAMYHSKRMGRDRVSFVVEPGAYACVRPEADGQVSRRHERWPSTGAGFFAEQSS